MSGPATTAAALRRPCPSRQYVESIIRPIVPDPDAVRVYGDQAGDVTVITITASGTARGCIMGKGGATLSAIRQLVRAYSGLHRVTITVNLESEGATSNGTEFRTGR